MLHVPENFRRASSALVGMQPQLRQMPPRYLCVRLMAVLNPSCEASDRGDVGAGPEPIMMMSNEESLMGSHKDRHGILQQSPERAEQLCA